MTKFSVGPLFQYNGDTIDKRHEEMHLVLEYLYRYNNKQTGTKCYELVF